MMIMTGIISLMLQVKCTHYRSFSVLVFLLKVHRFLNTMKVDGDGEIDDGESASSEEGSHADSGKGPSESGEPQQQGQSLV